MPENGIFPAQGKGSEVEISQYVLAALYSPTFLSVRSFSKLSLQQLKYIESRI